jgi:hypothetical protein
VKSRLAGLRKRRGHPVPQDGGRLRKSSPTDWSGAALGGDSKRGERGLVDRAVVLVDRIDCRSRQAAHGPHDPGRIARAIVEGLASSCESTGGANARRKPDHGGKALRPVAGVACEGGQRTCRGKALRAGKSATVDAGAGEAVLAPRCCSAFSRESAGRDRERQRSGHQRRSRPKTLQRGGPLKPGPVSFSR